MQAAPAERAPEAALDTIRDVATPELIELRLRCAGPVPRACAYLLDLLIRLGILAVTSPLLELLGRAGAGIGMVLFFALEWLYPVFFEMLGSGATPGKRAFGLAVLSEDGSPLTWGSSLSRNLLRAADFLPFLYAFGLISMLCSREFRRLGDQVAGTLVVYRDIENRLPEVPAGPPWRSRVPLNRQAQRAVLAFAERAPRLSPARAEELAELVPALTDGASGQLGVQRLYGIARVITGQERG
ncbi:RDD family protein [Niveibacterium sp. SC-1]|uniref:RDD family protein n=1 Tax=Niveibacterium sp. SC-1 TaxID=3135646 RepID=UPI00311D54FF